MGREVDSPRTIPGGSAVPDGTVAQLYKKTDLITPVASVAVSAGKYDHSYDGSYGPIETRVTYSGETRVRDSWSIGQAGPMMMSDLVYILRSLGNGVIAGDRNQLQITAGGVGRTVLVRNGSGLAAGITYNQITDNKPSPTFATNTSGQPRIDLIGFQVWTPGHAEEGRSELAILQGVPAAVPVPATPTQNPVAGTWFEPLAQVLLASGYATITSGNITDARRYVGQPAPLVTERLGTGVLIANNNQGTSTATCNAGEVCTGGGYFWSTTASAAVVVSTSRKQGNGWRAIGFNNKNSGSETLTAIALCLALS